MLSKYHGGHYKVYNLCCEKAYDPSRFIDGEFVAFPFDDHEVPALPMLFDFVRYVLPTFLCFCSRTCNPFLLPAACNTIVLEEQAVAHARKHLARCGACVWNMHQACVMTARIFWGHPAVCMLL
jgi:hypothetical protein